MANCKNQQTTYIEVAENVITEFVVFLPSQLQQSHQKVITYDANYF